MFITYKSTQLTLMVKNDDGVCKYFVSLRCKVKNENLIEQKKFLERENFGAKNELHLLPDSLYFNMMKYSKLYYFLILFFVLPILVLQNTGCVKEYSYEGGDTSIVISDSMPQNDTVTTPKDTSKLFPECTKCIAGDSLGLGDWNFKAGNSYLCGSVTNSGFFSGNTKMDITFFGPSACSVDTGLVISAYFSVPLDRDRFNITTPRAAFYYYDHNAPEDILDSRHEKVFSVTLQSFIYATGIATGTFSGTVFKANGDTAFISEGKFKVLIK
ncbi:MAG TPA: hypothetical protein VFI29_04815 [Hanamia sp.]|nr:hypothetical protein [Hanamia sp.]